MSSLRPAALALVTFGALACDNAGSDLGVGLPAGRALSAQIYFDSDFSGTATAADTTIAGIRVYLMVGGTQVVLDSTTTDATGLVGFTNLEPGPYTISVDSAQALGDSLLTTLTPAVVTVTNTGPTPFISARLGYPELTVSGARGAAAGRRVVVAATVLAGGQLFGDSSAFVRDSTGAIRLPGSVVSAGGSVIPGDLVRVLGRVGSRGGQPVLEAARIALFFPGFANPAPDTLTSAEAANALAGARDADLARVLAGEITDTITQGADFLVTIDDGSGPLGVLIDGLLRLPTVAFVPGDSLNVLGVLAPLGGGTWQLRPRAQQDLTVF
jgi:hypothetical protein